MWKSCPAACVLRDPWGCWEQAGLVVWGSSHLGISSQGVEQLLRCLVALAGSPLPETGSDLIEGLAFGLGNFEVGEDEEQNQEHREDDEDVGTTQLLKDTDTLGWSPDSTF